MDEDIRDRRATVLGHAGFKDRGSLRVYRNAYHLPALQQAQHRLESFLRLLDEGFNIDIRHGSFREERRGRLG